MLKNVNYIKTTHLISEMPEDDKPEVVIVGKSNVGKSTFINTITNHRNLAHISSKPGKTRAISLFDVDGEWRLVDIPGYGYAKVSSKQLEIFGEMIEDYFTNRTNIYKVILLLDMRRGITDDDRDMISYFHANEIPFVVVGTKLDKVNQSEAHKFNKQIQEELNTTVINYSALTKKGLDKVELLMDNIVE